MMATATFDTSPQDRDTPCPPAESLARYIDGLAGAAEASQIESHVAVCDDCLSVFAETSRQRKTNRTLLPFGGWRPQPLVIVFGGWRPQPLVIVGLATAAAIVLLLILPRQDPAAYLALSVQRMQAAVGPYREFESRLSADTTYRQMASVTRSAGQSGDSSATTAAAEEEKRTAAVDLQKAASAAPDHDAAARALGVMYFNLGDAGRAVEALEPLASSTDGGVLNDLAAAYLARRGDGDTQKALRMLERVVEREPQRAEAWFNLGLAAEADGQRERAIQAWNKTLQLDATSGWAAESRFRLQRLTTR